MEFSFLKFEISFWNCSWVGVQNCWLSLAKKCQNRVAGYNYSSDLYKYVHKYNMCKCHFTIKMIQLKGSFPMKYLWLRYLKTIKVHKILEQ